LIYDIIIIGAGPAGFAAAIYAARRRATAVIFEAEAIGGQIAKAHLVENYPGIMSISGPDLAKVMSEQVKALGVEVRFEKVVDLDKDDDHFVAKTDRGDYRARTIIFATGAQPRKLGTPDEDKYVGRGVSYCAICDAPFFRGKTVAVAGGGDSAVKTALFLTEYAEKVYLIHRRDTLRAEPLTQEKLFANKKAEVLWNKIITAIKGEKMVEEIVLQDTKTTEKKNLKVSGVFVEIGGMPAGVLAGKLGVEVDEKGYVKVDKAQRTNVPGFFAAGDITDFPLRQVATAVGQGATAATSACEFVGK